MRKSLSGLDLVARLSTTHHNAVICADRRQPALTCPRDGKDIPTGRSARPLPHVKRCSRCGVLIERRLSDNRKACCDECKRIEKREAARVKLAERERERVLAALRELTSESRNKRDALAIVEELVRLYHGPIGLAARLQELDADLKIKGDLANQARLFEAVIAILSRVSQTD